MKILLAIQRFSGRIAGMDTTELKQIVARHFDFTTHGQGQYLHGEWFSPKHQDSLNDLLEQLILDHEEEITQLRAENDSLESDVENLKDEIKELEKEVAEA